MNIIEKLGIKPIRAHLFYADVHAKTSEPYCKADEVREVEQQNAEMLEALIDQELSHEKCNAVSESIVKIIEKVADETWEQIKELFNDL